MPWIVDDIVFCKSQFTFTLFSRLSSLLPSFFHFFLSLFPLSLPSPSLSSATRETAILNAFLSAGATKGIAEACRENIIEGCTCERELTERIDGITYLHECGEDKDFAIGFLKDFYGLENSTCERDLVDKWNNELGYSVSGCVFCEEPPQMHIVIKLHTWVYIVHAAYMGILYIVRKVHTWVDIVLKVCM